MAITLTRSIDQSTQLQLKAVVDLHQSESDRVSVKIRDWFNNLNRDGNTLDYLRNEVLICFFSKKPLMVPVFVEEIAQLCEKTIVEMGELQINGKLPTVIPHLFAEQILGVINHTHSTDLVAVAASSFQMTFRNVNERNQFMHSFRQVVNSLASQEIVRIRIRAEKALFEESTKQMVLVSNRVLESSKVIVESAVITSKETEKQIEQTMVSTKEIREGTQTFLSTKIDDTITNIATKESVKQQTQAQISAQEIEIEQLRAKIN